MRPGRARRIEHCQYELVKHLLDYDWDDEPGRTILFTLSGGPTDEVARRRTQSALDGLREMLVHYLCRRIPYIGAEHIDDGITAEELEVELMKDLNPWQVTDQLMIREVRA